MSIQTVPLYMYNLFRLPQCFVHLFKTKTCALLVSAHFLPLHRQMLHFVAIKETIQEKIHGTGNTQKVQLCFRHSILFNASNF